LKVGNMRHSLHLLLMVTLLLSTGCSGGNQLPKKAKAILERADHIELLSLDPATRRTHSSNNAFHDYEVLGKIDLVETDSRRQVISSLFAGVADPNGNPKACFEPRHGIRATANGSRVDLVICFECGQLKAYIDDVDTTPSNIIVTAPTPASTFNSVLIAAKVPLPEPPSEGE
jgi:hypothetical protein